MKMKLILLSFVLFYQLFNPLYARTSGFISNVNNLKVQMDELTVEIDKINSHSRVARKISEEYKTIALTHADVVTSYTKVKASCLNLEDKYARKNKKSRPEPEIRKFQKKLVAKCYTRLQKITVNFDKINSDFLGLSRSIKILRSATDAESAELDSLEAQLNSYASMIKMEKSNARQAMKRAIKAKNDILGE